MRILIDIDGTVVDSFKKWDLYCLERYNKTWKEIHKLNSLDESSHFEYLDFWKTPDLYDDLKPYEYCRSTIKKLSEKHQIIFISFCMHEHKKSKKEFLEKYFESENIEYVFIDTKYKHLISADYIIDDYYEYLNNCQQAGMIPIQFRNDYNKQKFDNYLNWNEINDFFLKLSKNTIQ